MRFLFFFLLFLSLTASAEDVAKAKIEDLILWKMSDELSLKPADEKKMGDLIKTLNQRKSDLNSDMQLSLQKMKVAKTAEAKSVELAQYRKKLEAYNQVSMEEFDKMKSLLGPDKMIQYLHIKQDITNRLKNLLANPEGSSLKKPALPAPKIIEE